MLKSVITTILISFSLTVFAQVNKDEQMLKMIKTSLYSKLKKTFQTKNTLNNKVNPKTEFVWDLATNVNQTQLNSHFEYLSKNFTSELEEDKLNLELKLPLNVKIDKNLIQFKNDTSFLVDENNHKVDIYKNMNVGGFGMIENENGKFQTVKRTIYLDTIHKNVKGKLLLNVEVKLSFDKVKLTKADIGKEFVISNTTFKLLEILDGQVILKKISGEYEFSSFDVIITNENNKAYLGSIDKISLSTDDYQFGLKNPQFTEADFNIYFETIVPKLKDKTYKTNIFVLRFDNEPVNLYLYKANNVFSKKIEIEIKN
ncbi:MAG: hypothetical protein RLZZ175_2114 [Bacteroidota bacterium]|jgi:hypothetical protein